VGDLDNIYIKKGERRADELARRKKSVGTGDLQKRNNRAITKIARERSTQGGMGGVGGRAIFSQEGRRPLRPQAVPEIANLASARGWISNGEELREGEQRSLLNSWGPRLQGSNGAGKKTLLQADGGRGGRWTTFQKTTGCRGGRAVLLQR